MGDAMIKSGRLKDKAAWEVRKLAIHVAGDTKPFFISGKEALK